MGTPEKRTTQLPVTHNLDVRFADENSKSLPKHAYSTYLLICMTLELLCLNKF